MGLSGLFFFIFFFAIQLTVNICSTNFADDWIWTVNLWYRKRLLYQLRHNHCPFLVCFMLTLSKQKRTKVWEQNQEIWNIIFPTNWSQHSFFSVLASCFFTFVHKCSVQESMMLGFEPRSCGIRSDRSSNCATATSTANGSFLVRLINPLCKAHITTYLCD